MQFGVVVQVLFWIAVGAATAWALKSQTTGNHRGSTSNEEGELLCEMDNWELGGMRFGVLAQVRFWVLFRLGAGDST